VRPAKTVLLTFAKTKVTRAASAKALLLLLLLLLTLPLFCFRTSKAFGAGAESESKVKGFRALGATYFCLGKSKQNRLRRSQEGD
jgi:hypothetical protein